jgi:hypothetical protein
MPVALRCADYLYGGVKDLPIDLGYSIDVSSVESLMVKRATDYLRRLDGSAAVK